MQLVAQHNLVELGKASKAISMLNLDGKESIIQLEG